MFDLFDYWVVCGKVLGDQFDCQCEQDLQESGQSYDLVVQQQNLLDMFEVWVEFFKLIGWFYME